MNECPKCAYVFDKFHEVAYGVNTWETVKCCPRCGADEYTMEFSRMEGVK